MSLAPGTRVGSYEVTGSLGAGGMGEVYRARDTRLNRDVALKILPDELARDADRRARFEREAQILASLSHPNIAVIHGVEDGASADGPGADRSLHALALVLELIEGPTLAEEIRRGGLPVERALPIARQIAEALEAAHGHGVVHRDLKPSNIKLRPDGLVKVLDFGLAKALQPAAAPADASQSSTVMSPAMTRIGAIIGTAAYMSPEQARGRDADKRSDVWAFGCVLYEILTGTRAFKGDDVTDTMAAILRAEPDWSALPPALPPSIVRLLHRSLEKDHARRLRDAGDARLEIEDAMRPGGASETPLRGRVSRRELAAWSAAAIGWAGAFGAWRFRDVPASSSSSTLPSPVHRSALLPPAGTFFSPYDFAISPDGRRVAFVGIATDGSSRLWVRSLDGRGAQQSAATGGAKYPFWSPDGRRIGFFADEQLKVADLESGATQPLADARQGRGGTWNNAGVILFAPYIDGPLLRVSERGGRSERATDVDPASGKAHRWPWFLPDQTHFVFFEDWGVATDSRPNGIYVGSLAGGETRLVSADISGSVAFAADHLLHVQDASLMAQPFDLERLAPNGPAVALLDREIGADFAFQHGNFSASANGVLVFQSRTDSVTELIWHAADGRVLGPLPVLSPTNPTFSRDGRSLAFSAEEAGGRSYIRSYDLERGIGTQLTSGGRESAPVWSPDGRTIAYAGYDGNAYTLHELEVGRSGEPQTLLSGPRITPTDYSPDGRLLALMRFDAGAPSIVIYDRVERRSTTWARGAEAQYSPDGQWLAFVVLSHVFVQSVDGRGARVQISSTGGAQPRWSHDGTRIFYLAPDRKLMEVPVEIRARALVAGVPRALFQTRVVAPAYASFQYDVTGDGSRFIVNSLRPEAPLTLLTGWPGLLNR